MVTKTGLEKFHRPGSHVSPACLATCLTWLQAGRLKSPRDKSCSYSPAPFPSRRPSDNRLKAYIFSVKMTAAESSREPYRVVHASTRRQWHLARSHDRGDGGCRPDLARLSL